ncbi:KEOPS complex subunit Pcc1 [Geoglobus sp.]
MRGVIEVEGKAEWLEVLSRVFVEKPEERRSRAKVYLTQGKFVVEIEASDLTALRASVNSYLRLIRTCVETLEVIDDG